MVDATAANEIEPPPAFETDTGLLRAVAPCTKGKVTVFGLTLKLGWPAGVTVNEIGILTADGLAFLDAIVTAPV